MNAAIGREMRPATSVTDLIGQLQEQTAFLSIVLCCSLLERHEESRTFQQVYKLVKTPGIDKELMRLNELSCPTDSIKRFLHFYGNIEWAAFGRLQHFRNRGIAHLADKPASRSVTYQELENMVFLLCNLSRETCMMVRGLNHNPHDDYSASWDDAADFWRNALMQAES